MWLVSRGGWLAGYQMALDTAKTAKSRLSQNNFAIGYCKDDLTLHTAVYVYSSVEAVLKFSVCK